MCLEDHRHRHQWLLPDSDAVIAAARRPRCRPLGRPRSTPARLIRIRRGYDAWWNRYVGCRRDRRAAPRLRPPRT
jgi:hypothetical protein